MAYLLATFGLWEYLAQSNNNADCVDPEYRFKFVDDLTVLEKINLLIIGLTSFNTRVSVPSDIPSHNQYIPAENLKSSEYIEAIQNWTENQKMILNQKKTKVISHQLLMAAHQNLPLLIHSKRHLCATQRLIIYLKSMR